MNLEQIAAKLIAAFPEAGLELKAETKAPYIGVPASHLLQVCERAIKDPELGGDCLTELGAWDMPEAQQIWVRYHIHSYSQGHDFALQVILPRDNPSVPTVSGLWKVANWLEREQFDLVGVHFEGHPNLRRLLLPDEWNGHPLRRDYVEGPQVLGIETTRDNYVDMLRGIS